MWRAASGLSAVEVRAKANHSAYWFIYSYGRTVYHYLCEPQLFIIFVGTICAAIALGVPGYEFLLCFLLLDIIFQSQDLLNVIAAVTTNIKSLLWTMVLGLVIIYIFAVFARNIPEIQAAWSPDSSCSDLSRCFVHVLSDGLREGDLGQVMNELPDYDTSLVAFQLLFWLIITTVLLNIIFGIIIDTFSELRAIKENKRSHMDNFCFICGLDRFKLDTMGGGFDEHIEEDHNMWNYLYLMVYLHAKQTTEMNGWESYVYAKMLAQKTDFIPRNTAISIAHHIDEERREARALSDAVTKLTAGHRALSKTVATIAAAITEIKPTIEASVEAAMGIGGGPQPPIQDRVRGFVDEA